MDRRHIGLIEQIRELAISRLILAALIALVPSLTVSHRPLSALLPIFFHQGTVS